jgi:uncharacterized protein YjbI with pentapeptide repeats
MKKLTNEECIYRLSDHHIWRKRQAITRQYIPDGISEFKIHDYDIMGVSFFKKDLTLVKFYGINCQGVDFRNAYCSSSTFFNCDMRNANLTNANFIHADLRFTKFDDALINAGTILQSIFTSDALPWLILRSDWLSVRDFVHIVDCESQQHA